MTEKQNAKIFLGKKTGTPKPDEFVNQQISLHLFFLRKQMQKQAEVIENSKLLHRTSNNLMKNASGFVNVQQSHFNYFNIIRDYDIPTVLINITLDTLEHLDRSVFHHTSNNCSSMRRDGGFYGPNWYKLYCVQSEHFWKAVNFTTKVFRIGIPRGVAFMDGENITVSWLHIISDSLVTPSGEVYTNHLKIIPDGCKARRRRFYPWQQMNHTVDFVFTIAQYYGQYFYHATIEQLGRLSPYLEFLRRNEHIKVHVKSVTSFVLELFTQLGIDTARIISGYIHANILYLPSGQKCDHPSFFNLQYLSMEFRLKLQPVKANRTVILIKRSKKRWFKQHMEIKAALNETIMQYNLQLEVFSDKSLPSLKSTMDMFNRALLVVGPHGAGESNLLFSQKGTFLVEGLCYTRLRKINLCYSNIMSALGHHFYGVLPTTRDCFDIEPHELVTPVRHILNKVLT